MRLQDRSAPGTLPLAVRPLVWLTVVYGGLASIRYLWLASTARAAPVDQEGPVHLIGRLEYGLVGAANLALLVLLWVELRASRRSAPGQKLAHAAGAGLGILVVVSIQILARIARAPHDLPGWFAAF